MHSDNPDKQLFAATDTLPDLPAGVQFRPAEVWAGLEGALARRRRRALVLRMSVAAMLLLALALGWWLRPQALPAPDIARHQDPKKVAPVLAKEEPIDRAAPPAVAATVEIQSRPDRRKTLVHREASTASGSEPIASVPPQADSNTSVAAIAAAPSPAPPAQRRFRIAHMNENTPLLSASTEAPIEERGNYGLFHNAGSSNAGPNPDLPDGTGERKPRTLMSVFKPHQ